MMAARILLVEDDAFLAFDLARSLEQAGFKIAPCPLIAAKRASVPTKFLHAF